MTEEVNGDEFLRLSASKERTETCHLARCATEENFFALTDVTLYLQKYIAQVALYILGAAHAVTYVRCLCTVVFHTEDIAETSTVDYAATVKDGPRENIECSSALAFQQFRVIKEAHGIIARTFVVVVTIVMLMERANLVAQIAVDAPADIHLGI